MHPITKSILDGLEPSSRPGMIAAYQTQLIRMRRAIGTGPSGYVEAVEAEQMRTLATSDVLEKISYLQRLVKAENDRTTVSEAHP